MTRISLRFRFIVTLSVLLLIVFLAITIFIVDQTKKTLTNDLIKESQAFAALSTQPIGNAYDLFHDSGTIKLDQQVNNFTSLDRHINQIEILDTNGKQLYALNKNTQIKTDINAIDSINTSYIYNKNGNLNAIVSPYIETYGIHRYTLVFGVSYISVNQSIQSIISNIVILSLVILLLALILAYTLINQFFLRPVAKVSGQALKISKGDLDIVINHNRNDEIGDLAIAVQTMSNSLKEDINKLKHLDDMKNEFMMITSHNLRTPISIIESYVDTLGTIDISNEAKELIEPIIINVDKLKDFSEDMLTISAVEAGQNIFHKEEVELAPFIGVIAGEFAKIAKQKNIKFIAKIDTKSYVQLSKPHFRSALWNLLDNAYKFTSEEGQIDLITNDEGDKVKLSVRDTGKGISDVEMARLFTKFHRGTSMLTYNYEGTGIGLYVTKIIIKEHNGSISVQSVLDAGSTFTITLPTIHKSSNSSHDSSNHIQ